MNTLDEQYLDLLERVMDNGIDKDDRTGVGTRSVFGHTMEFDLSEGISLLTTKRVHWPSVLHELLWFLKGGTDIKYLVDNDVKIWNDWPYKKYVETPIQRMSGSDVYHDTGDVKRHFTMEEYVQAIKDVPGFAERHGRVGKVYGAQWTDWTYPIRARNGMHVIRGWNQLDKLIDTLRNNPDSRRMLVTAWNPPEMEEVALPCCHYAFQCYTTPLTVEERVRIYAGLEGQTYDEFKANWDTDEQWIVDLDDTGVPKRKLSLMFQMRSVDSFLGMPFDIASYSFLVHMIAKQVNMVPDKLLVNSGDTHIYRNHFDQVKTQLARKPHENLPKLKLRDGVESIFDYEFDDFEIIDYTHEPTIKAPIAV